jgi:uncharacterized protein with PIN domain
MRWNVSAIRCKDCEKIVEPVLVTHPTYDASNGRVKSYTNYWTCPECTKTLVVDLTEDK